MGDLTTARAKRRLAWAGNLSDHIAFIQWTPKQFVLELNQAGLEVSRQAVDCWLKGTKAPSPESQVVVAKVLRTAPHVLFPVEAA